MKNRLIFCFFAFLLGACANSPDERNCLDQNWQTYGESVALKGRELGRDKYYKNCIQLEVGVNTTMAELGYDKGKKLYCTEEYVKKAGDEGQFFNFSFCQFPNEDELRVVHSKSIEAYCTSENAFNLGLEGKFYNQICPTHLETLFSKNFNRGRRQRLFSEVKGKQFELDKTDLEISSLRLQQSQVTRDLLALPAVVPQKKSGLSLSGILPSRSSSLEQRRNELSQALHQLQDKILKLKRDKADIKIEVKVLEKEIQALKNR